MEPSNLICVGLLILSLVGWVLYLAERVPPSDDDRPGSV